MKLGNSGWYEVTAITYFNSGKWDGGIVYSSTETLVISVQTSD